MEPVTCQIVLVDQDWELIIAFNNRKITGDPDKVSFADSGRRFSRMDEESK